MNSLTKCRIRCGDQRTDGHSEDWNANSQSIVTIKIIFDTDRGDLWPYYLWGRVEVADHLRNRRIYRRRHEHWERSLLRGGLWTWKHVHGINPHQDTIATSALFWRGLNRSYMRSWFFILPYSWVPLSWSNGVSSENGMVRVLLSRDTRNLSLGVNDIENRGWSWELPRPPEQSITKLCSKITLLRQALHAALHAAVNRLPH